MKKKVDWVVEDMAKAHESSGVTSIKYSACGRFIVSSGNDHKVRLWSTNDGELHSINYEMSCSSNLPFAMEIITDFSCAGDDVLAFPTGENGEIALVALHSSTGKPFNLLTGHFGAVTAVTYRQKHGQLISSGKDGMIHVWDSSIADREKENNTQHRRNNDNHTQPGEHDRYYGVDADNWSDDDCDRVNAIKIDTNNITDGDMTTATLPRAPTRSFIPPILQRYFDDAAESNRLLLLEKERIKTANSGPGSGPRSSSSSSVRTNRMANQMTGRGGGRGTGFAMQSYGKGTWKVRVKEGDKKVKPKSKQKEREESIRDRAIAIFAAQSSNTLNLSLISQQSTNLDSSLGPSSVLYPDVNLTSNSNSNSLSSAVSSSKSNSNNIAGNRSDRDSNNNRNNSIINNENSSDNSNESRIVNTSRRGGCTGDVNGRCTNTTNETKSIGNNNTNNAEPILTLNQKEKMKENKQREKEKDKEMGGKKKREKSTFSNLKDRFGSNAKKKRN